MAAIISVSASDQAETAPWDDEAEAQDIMLDALQDMGCCVLTVDDSVSLAAQVGCWSLHGSTW